MSGLSSRLAMAFLLPGKRTDALYLQEQVHLQLPTPPKPPNPQAGQAGPSWGSRRLSTDLSPPVLRQDGESCAKATARWRGARPAALSCQGKEAAKRPARSSSFPVPSAVAGPFLTSERLSLPPPRQPRCLLPSLPTPPAHQALPWESSQGRVQQGRPAG